MTPTSLISTSPSVVTDTPSATCAKNPVKTHCWHVTWTTGQVPPKTTSRCCWCNTVWTNSHGPFAPRAMEIPR